MIIRKPNYVLCTHNMVIYALPQISKLDPYCFLVGSIRFRVYVLSREQGNTMSGLGSQ